MRDVIAPGPSDRIASFCVMMAYDFVLLADLSLPCCSRMGLVIGLWVGCLRVQLGFFFLELFEVSVLSLVVHCWDGGFLMGYTSVEVFWFTVFRPVCSSLVSTHHTGLFGVRQSQRALAQGMRDGL